MAFSRFKSLKYRWLKKERFPVLFLVLIETTHDVPFVGVQLGAPEGVLPIIAENNSTTVAIALVNLKTPHNQKSFLYRGLAPLDDTNIQYINDFVNSFLKKSCCEFNQKQVENIVRFAYWQEILIYGIMKWRGHTLIL